MARVQPLRLLVLLLCLCAQAAGTATSMRRNPVRKVVTMLQQMTAQVEEEGKKEKELFDKFMCYCKTSGGSLQNSIEDSKKKIPELESAIEASVSKKSQLDKDLEDHKADKKKATDAMAAAVSVRDKEKAEFTKESEEAKAEASQIAGARTSLAGGGAKAFLQTGSSDLRRIVSTRESMAEQDREDLLEFLDGKGEAPAPGEVQGILSVMADEMAKSMAEAAGTEKDAEENFLTLMSAKKKEVRAGTKLIEEKLQRVGQLAMEIESLKNELSDVKSCLTEDRKMLATLKKSCSTKEEENDKAVKILQEELVALADTIKLLNDDDARELFTKTLPGAGASSFLQVEETERDVRQRALHVLRAGRHGSVQMDFIAMALRGKKAGFDSVVAMIDKLAATLTEQQAEDEKKKAYCKAELAKSASKKRDFGRAVADTESAIAKAKEDVVSLGEALKKLTIRIKDLDKAVAEATEQRKEEHKEHNTIMADNGAAKELLSFALNRLNKFYNPKLYVAPPSAAPSFVQVRAHDQLRDQSESSADGSKSSGVIAMIQMLISDLDKDITEAKAEEQNAQANYEEAMKDAAAKRASDSKALAESQADKADLESAAEELAGNKKSAKKELAAVGKYIMTLHEECDWLLKYFDVRKQARTSELDSMSKAKDVMMGADYSFLQVSAEKAAHGAQRFLGHA